MMVWFSRLYLFLFLFYSPFYLLSSLSKSSPTSPLCHPDDTSALLQFKNSLSFSKFLCERYRRDTSRPCQTMFWKNGTDCCRWDGVTCDDITGHVIGLNLTRGGLNGTIQSNSSLFRLAHLKTLVLSRNDFSGSQISSEFGRFENMMHLDISHSYFAGQVPPEISYLSKLHTIDLSFNYDLRLEASTLKRIIENTTNLTQLFLSDLDMSSIAPISLMNLSSSLKSLNLSYTRLQGKFPEGMFRRPNLQVLNLNGNTNLSLSFPKYNWSSPIKELSLSSTNISIDLPHLVKCFKNLNALTLSNCHFTRSDDLTPLGNLTKLTWLDLSYNNFSGHIPWNSLNLERLTFLNLGSNKFVGHLPIPPPSLTFFSISNNQLTGKIPSQICNASFLQVLDLSNNRLNESLPPCLGNFSKDLSVLDLRNNKLQGMIPTFANISLRSLNFNGNQLEGPLPQSLRTCKKVEVLDVGNNKINGSFPNWLESLPELQILILRSNRFYGPIGDPMARFPFRKLRIIDLSNNNFTGHLPRKYFESLSAMLESHAAEFGYMGDAYYTDSVMVDMKGVTIELVKIQKIFTTIDLSRNHFLGEIPNVIGRLKSLHGLNFSHNKLSGSIPPSLRNLSNLEWLDLSSNELVGVIPVQLANLSFLAFLQLSHNKLVGPIPGGYLFNTFENDSYIGNVGLCGLPLSKTCDNEKEQQPSPRRVQQAEDYGFDWKFIWMGYISGLVIGILAVYIVRSRGKFDHWFSQWAGREGGINRMLA